MEEKKEEKIEKKVEGEPQAKLEGKNQKQEIKQESEQDSNKEKQTGVNKNEKKEEQKDYSFRRRYSHGYMGLCGSRWMCSPSYRRNDPGSYQDFSIDRCKLIFSYQKRILVKSIFQNRDS